MSPPTHFTTTFETLRLAKAAAKDAKEVLKDAARAIENARFHLTWHVKSVEDDFRYRSELKAADALHVAAQTKDAQASAALKKASADHASVCEQLGFVTEGGLL